MAKEKIAVGCTSSAAYDSAKAVGVPTISVPTLYKLPDTGLGKINGWEFGAREKVKELLRVNRSALGKCDFVFIGGQFSPDMQAVLEEMFPPSPLNRFFKTN